MKEFTITVPYPISVNRYLGRCGNRTFLRKEGIEFKDICRKEVLKTLEVDEITPTDKLIEVEVVVYPKLTKDWVKRETNFGDLKDFTFLPYTLLVQSTTYPGNPVAIELTDNTMDIGLNGGIKGDKVYEGFNQAIERFLFHSQTDQWEFPMEVYKNNGVLYI